VKRYGYLWKDVIDFDNLLLAHHNARKGKTWYKEVKMVDSDPYYYIDKIYHMLNDKTYSVSPYKVFVHNDSGKERIISKLPYYPDRIIQWALIQIRTDFYKHIHNRHIFCNTRTGSTLWFEKVALCAKR